MSELGECLLAFVFGSIVGLLAAPRPCNTAALRDAILFKTYRNTKALLVAMMILTIGFTGFISVGEGKTMYFDVGVNQFVGLFIFGIGMVLPACTVSTWVKAGEGNFGAVWACCLRSSACSCFPGSCPLPIASSASSDDRRVQSRNAVAWLCQRATLQQQMGIPAIFFGLVQFAVLFWVYKIIRRKEDAAAT